MTSLRDMAERTLWTATESFLAVIIGSGVLDLSVSTLQAAGISAISAAVTVVFVWVRQQRAKLEARDSSSV